MIILFIYILGVLPFFQDFLAAAANLVIGKSLSLMVIVAKDLIVILLFIYFTFKIKQNRIILYVNILIILAFLLFLFAVLVFPNLSSIVASIRSILICFMAISVGFYGLNKVNFHSFIKIITFIAIITGLIDFIISDSLWFSINITDFITNVKNDPVINGLPANMYGDLGNGWFSTRRLVGLTGVPLTYGYLLIPIVVYWINILKYKPTDYFVILVNIFLIFLLYFTYTRAAYIAVIITIYFSTKSIVKKLFIIIFPILLLITIPTFQDAIIRALLDGSTALHILSLIEGFNQITFLGSGLGQVGIFAQRYGSQEFSLENSFLFILIQLGIPYFILYLIVFIIILKKLTDCHYFPFRSFFIGIMITGIVSEQLFSPTSIIISYMIIGYGISKSYERNKIDAR